MKRLLVIFVMLVILSFLAYFLESILPGNVFSFTIEQEKKLFKNSAGIIDYLLLKINDI